MIKLENKLYSSTEVADILGVSLRSVYRYLEEDKLKAEVKTATGRHRFTRQNIIDFLYPTGIPEGEVIVEQTMSPAPRQVHEKIEEKVVEMKEEIEIQPRHLQEEPKIEVQEEKVEVEEPEVEMPKVEEVKESDDQVDWLAKFREAAKKFEESSEEVTGLGVQEEVEETVAVEETKPSLVYYRSRLGGLKDIAQNIDKTSRNSGLDYAFTLNAGLSLYKPINPFSVLHVYVRSKDKDFFERILALTPSDESNAQLCIVTSDEDDVYANADEMHGLRVVEKNRLVEDISEMSEDLMKEAQDILK